MRWWILAWSLCAAMAAAGGSFEEAAAQLQAHKTVQAGFVLKRESALFTEAQEQRGRLELRRADGRLLWLVDDGPQILFAGGRSYPAFKTAQEAGKDGAAGYAMPGGMDLSRFLTGFFTLDAKILGASFDIAPVDGGFELKPKDEPTRALFASVRLQVGGEPFAVRSVQIRESTGDSMALTFEGLAVDAPLDDARFLTPTERSAR